MIMPFHEPCSHLQPVARVTRACNGKDIREYEKYNVPDTLKTPRRQVNRSRHREYPGIILHISAQLVEAVTKKLTCYLRREKNIGIYAKYFYRKRYFDKIYVCMFDLISQPAYLSALHPDSVGRIIYDYSHVCVFTKCISLIYQLRTSRIS